MNGYVPLFRWAVLLGFVATNFFALPGIFAPAAVADVLGGPPPVSFVWPAFAFLLSFLVSWFYLPAALDPLGNQPTAWLIVLSRFVGAAFWYWLYPGLFPLLGHLDLTFGILQLVLLVLLVRHAGEPA